MFNSAFDNGIFTIPIDQTFQKNYFSNKKLKYIKLFPENLSSDDSSSGNNSYSKDNLLSFENNDNLNFNHKKKSLVFTENLNNDWKMLIVIKQINSFKNLTQSIYN